MWKQVPNRGRNIKCSWNKAVGSSPSNIFISHLPLTFLSLLLHKATYWWLIKWNWSGTFSSQRRHCQTPVCMREEDGEIAGCAEEKKKKGKKGMTDADSLLTLIWHFLKNVSNKKIVIKPSSHHIFTVMVHLAVGRSPLGENSSGSWIHLHFIDTSESSIKPHTKKEYVKIYVKILNYITVCSVRS